MEAYTILLKDILCSVWQNLSITQIMTTVHSVEDIETSEFISSQKRNDIPLNSVIETLDDNQAIPISFPICKYNNDIGGSDVNA